MPTTRGLGIIAGVPSMAWKNLQFASQTCSGERIARPGLVEHWLHSSCGNLLLKPARTASSFTACKCKSCGLHTNYKTGYKIKLPGTCHHGRVLARCIVACKGCTQKVQHFATSCQQSLALSFLGIVTLFSCSTLKLSRAPCQASLFVVPRLHCFASSALLTLVLRCIENASIDILCMH